MKIGKQKVAGFIEPKLAVMGKLPRELTFCGHHCHLLLRGASSNEEYGSTASCIAPDLVQWRIS